MQTTIGPTFTPVAGRRNLREEIATALRAAIVAGQLLPDTVYSVPTLSVQFGVSPTPVREAILDLAKEGLIDVVKNKGFRISPLSDAELDEITEIRSLLEVPTVTALTGGLGQGQLARLRELAQSIVDAARAGEMVAYIEADMAFHLELISLGGNARLVRLVEDLRNRSRLYGLNGLARQGLLVDSAAEHLTLVELLSGGDPAAVAALMQGHLRHVRGIWAAPTSPSPAASAPAPAAPAPALP